MICIHADPLIYCDLDGVLTDFSSDFLSWYMGDFQPKNSNWPEFKGSHVNELQDLLKQRWYQLISLAPESFWSEMSWISCGKDLWKLLEPLNPVILSTPAMSIASKEGKRKWVQKNLGDQVPVILSPNKHQFIKQNLCVEPDRVWSCKILIDDWKNNIDQWQSCGGVGILHCGFAETKNALQKYLKKVVR